MCSTNGNSTATGSLTRPSYLFAFDFDHTVVHDNSDTYIFKLLDGGIPAHIKEFMTTYNWTEGMNMVFEHMHEKGITVEDICGCVRSMEPTKGMLHLLTSLVQLKTQPPPADQSEPPRVDILVISDANTLFIREYLTSRVLEPLLQNRNVHVTFPFDIITNKSSVTTSTNNNLSQPLSIIPYALQSTCNICPKNLCKGSALVKYMESHGPYTRVFYTGDGWNDVCPSRQLNQHDIVFPRRGYSLWKKITKSSDKLGINAEIVEWEGADTIEEVVNQSLGISA